ncbi:MAG: carboxypeptidase-like regulatory domain-containing protein [Actinobacteria bacterium]|nr:carboxypeptidase-like regulatory domain-containing protein [Actinomycetota bacterium]
MRICSVVFLLVAACSRAEVSTYEVSGVALAGPTCPVETDPPDPACAPRPVVGAVIDAFDSTDAVQASTVTDEGGSFTLALPPGDFTIVAQPAQGLMGTPSPIEITVGDGPIDMGVLAYDTGIR